MPPANQSRQVYLDDLPECYGRALLGIHPATPVWSRPDALRRAEAERIAGLRQERLVRRPGAPEDQHQSERRDQ